MKVTVDGADGDGKPVHSEWTGKYDGKDYPVTRDSSTDTRSYKKVNDHTLMFTNKKGEKVTISGRAVVSATTKSRKTKGRIRAASTFKWPCSRHTQ